MIRTTCWPAGMAVLVAAASAPAADWMTYNADVARRAVSTDRLALPLRVAWQVVPAQAPRPAWPEPGKEMHRLDFDYAPQPVMVGGLAYITSLADDTLRALAVETGRVTWRFTTGGPLRFAPAVADGKAYLASDDGPHMTGARAGFSITPPPARNCGRPAGGRRSPMTWS